MACFELCRMPGGYPAGLQCRNGGRRLSVGDDRGTVPAAGFRRILALCSTYTSLFYPAFEIFCKKILCFFKISLGNCKKSEYNKV